MLHHVPVPIKWFLFHSSASPFWSEQSREEKKRKREETWKKLCVYSETIHISGRYVGTLQSDQSGWARIWKCTNIRIQRWRSGVGETVAAGGRKKRWVYFTISLQLQFLQMYFWTVPHQNSSSLSECTEHWYDSDLCTDINCCKKVYLQLSLDFS